MAKKTYVQLRPDDNVVVATQNLPAGEILRVGQRAVGLQAPVTLGHKVSVEDISKGSAVRKFGQVIGFASSDIPAGSHVHLHNCAADSVGGEGGGDGEVNITYKKQLKISVISKNYYLHLRSLELYEDSRDVSSTVSEPIEIFSNIENGFGIFGSFYQTIIDF